MPGKMSGQEGEFHLGYDGSYRSDLSSNASPSAAKLVEGSGLSNFRLGFRSDEGFNLVVRVRNAFDANYFEPLFIAPGNTGLIAGLPGDPRKRGATVSIGL